MNQKVPIAALNAASNTAPEGTPNARNIATSAGPMTNTDSTITESTE